MMAPFYDVHSYDNDECGVGNEDEVHNDGLADEDNETDHDGDHGAGDRGEPVHGRGDGPADPREVHEGRQEEGEMEEKKREKGKNYFCVEDQQESISLREDWKVEKTEGMKTSRGICW